MYRSIIGQSIKKSIDLHAMKLQFTPSIRLQHQLRKEMTKVKIIGTIVDGPCDLRFDNKTRELTVETKDSNQLATSSIHNVHTKTQANLAAGQRIHIIGRLNAHTKKDSSGEDVTSTIVRALQLFVLENKSESASNSVDEDLNRVQLVGLINTDIVNMESDSQFSITVHGAYENENGEKKFGAYTQPILTFDQTVCQYLRNRNVEKGDEVLVNGQIGYRINDGSDGKTTSDCIIVADSICKIANKLEKIKK